MNEEAKNKFFEAQAEVDKAMAEWKAIVVHTEADLATQEQAKRVYKASCLVAAEAARNAGMEDEAFVYEFSSL